jgi:hypothetical protein
VIKSDAARLFVPLSQEIPTVVPCCSTIATFALQIFSMEQLLNFVWLLIALGSLAVCWRTNVCLGSAKRTDFLRLLIVAICLSAFALPIVSASDDMNAMSPDAEETGSSDCVLKKSSSTFSPTSGNAPPPVWALTQVWSLTPETRPTDKISDFPIHRPEQALANKSACRAPPCSYSLCADCARSSSAVSQFEFCARSLFGSDVASSMHNRMRVLFLRGHGDANDRHVLLQGAGI